MKNNTVQKYWYERGFEKGLEAIDIEKYYYEGFEDGINAAIKIITDYCGIMDIHVFNTIQELGRLIDKKK